MKLDDIGGSGFEPHPDDQDDQISFLEAVFADKQALAGFHQAGGILDIGDEHGSDTPQQGQPVVCVHSRCEGVDRFGRALFGKLFGSTSGNRKGNDAAGIDLLKDIHGALGHRVGYRIGRIRIMLQIYL